MSRGTAGRGRWWPPLVALLGAALALLGWGLASPVGSAQDDDFHLATIWCSPFAADPLCAPGATPTTRLAPAAWGETFACETVGDGGGVCMQAALGDLGLQETSRGNWDGNYPGYFHDALALLAGHDIEASVIAMRLANSALFLLVAVITWLLLPRRLRAAFAWSTAIAVVPQGAFLIASTNPESWAITAAAVIWIIALAVTEPGALRGGLRESWRSWLLLLLGLGAIVLGSVARSDAAMFAAGAVGLVALIRIPWTWRHAAWWAVPVAAGALALAWYAGHKQSTGAFEGLQAGHITAGTPSIVELTGIHGGLAVLLNAVLAPGMWVESWSAGLGSHQIAQPGVVALLAVLLAVGVAVLGLRRSALRKRLAVLLVVLALWALPVYLLWRTDAIIGSWLNPRYLIPLVQIAIGLLLVDIPGPSGWRGRAWHDSTPASGRVRTLAVPRFGMWTAALVVATVQAVALIAVLGWSVGGGDTTWWWLDLGWLSPVAVAVGGVLGGALTMLGLVLSARGRVGSAA